MVCPGAEEGVGHSVRSCWWSRKVRTEDCLAVGVFRDGLGKSSRGEAEEAKDSWVQERGGGQKLERMSMNTVLRKLAIKGGK